MKITIYELLGLIKDGKAPKKIKYEDETFNYVKTNRDGISYVNESKNYKDISRYLIYCIESLNDEVEIIEQIEDEFIDIDTINICRKEQSELAEKINEIIKNQKKIINKLKELN